MGYDEQVKGQPPADNFVCYWNRAHHSLYPYVSIRNLPVSRYSFISIRIRHIRL